MQGRAEDIGTSLNNETPGGDRASAADKPLLIIEPTSGWVPLNLRELWEFRELIGFLDWRDISSRYKQTVIGAGWAIIQPLLMMIVFTMFFGKLAKVPSDGIPYPIFSYCGLLPWQLFATAST